MTAFNNIIFILIKRYSKYSSDSIVGEFLPPLDKGKTVTLWIGVTHAVSVFREHISISLSTFWHLLSSCLLDKLHLHRKRHGQFCVLASWLNVSVLINAPVPFFTHYLLAITCKLWTSAYFIILSYILLHIFRTFFCIFLHFVLTEHEFSVLLFCHIKTSSVWLTDWFSAGI